jgi:hypothetical protein
MCMEIPPFDNSLVCRICNTLLSDIEIVEHRQARMPALCETHLIYCKEQYKKCAPLMQKMNLS